jgi:hypothetical protein
MPILRRLWGIVAMIVLPDHSSYMIPNVRVMEVGEKRREIPSIES